MLMGNPGTTNAFCRVETGAQSENTIQVGHFKSSHRLIIDLHDTQVQRPRLRHHYQNLRLLVTFLHDQQIACSEPSLLQETT